VDGALAGFQPVVRLGSRMSMPAMLVVLTLRFTDSYGQIDDEAAQRARLWDLKKTVEAHGWTIAGVALTALSTGLFVSAIEASSLPPRPDARLVGGLTAFAVTALLTAIGMVIYNATL
jgi:hypothetical protein